MALALVREDAAPLIHGLRALPSPAARRLSGRTSSATTTSGRSTSSPRPSARRRSRRSVAKPDMQLFGRGIRRRLPTMLNGDQARIRMVYSLTFSLPGAPVLFYGEEIGMSENLAIPGRQSVRSPMQWANEENGGFSTADPERLSRPVVASARLRPGGGQRRRSARRRELAPELDGAADPPPPRMPGDRLGRLAGPRDRPQERACAALRLRRSCAAHASTTWRRSVAGRCSKPDGAASWQALVPQFGAAATSCGATARCASSSTAMARAGSGSRPARTTILLL